MSITRVSLIFNIMPDAEKRMYEGVRKTLTDVGEVDHNTLVYLALNELTLGRTIAHTPTMSMAAKIPVIFPQYSYTAHEAIKQAVMVVASELYKEFFTILEGAHMSYPAVLSQAGISGCSVSTIFDSHEEPRPCNWQYSSSPQ
ncbi:hypothetical protein SIMMY50_221 [Erwinia phage vB_EamM_Simmy50]|uniref:Uncharacterized protein n=1 Tax=Erwinia phage vB_EamM_Simmy50 TaxID=1815988 RepID=A0A173GDJ0_9CAUD|nr:hypothetical protein FDH99_gp305 [Erwinia phage vB_EamM_Simmy50]ANH51680.1 hypothetical protein SIMMY50_221 [Erwinia phage vB_EamM_Simmy50]